MNRRAVGAWTMELLLRAEATGDSGSIAKFGSSPELRSHLVGTGDRVLVEAGPGDRARGVRMRRNNPSIERLSEWRGSNRLGFALADPA